MGDAYNNIADCNPKRNKKILIVSDGMIADIKTNKNFNLGLKNYCIPCIYLLFILFFCTKKCQNKF